MTTSGISQPCAAHRLFRCFRTLLAHLDRRSMVGVGPLQHAKRGEQFWLTTGRLKEPSALGGTPDTNLRRYGHGYCPWPTSTNSAHRK